MVAAAVAAEAVRRPAVAVGAQGRISAFLMKR